MFCKKDSKASRQLVEGVELTALVHGDKTLMGQFKIVKGAAVPLHSHPHEQTGFMVSGKLRFNVAGNITEAEPGDSWCISGDVEHSAEALEDSVVIEIFSPVREDYLP
ncbi:MAG: cupin domain-containing protein [Desulfobacterales bacterium]|nr:cupin domain-containing protein [Desulfobacterales bacterium]